MRCATGSPIRRSTSRRPASRRPRAPQRPERSARRSLHSEAPSGAARALRLVPDAPAVARAEQRALGLGWGSSTAAEVAALYDAPAGDSAAPAIPATPRSMAAAARSRTARPSRREDDIPMYSRLRVIGQLFAGYIALEGDDGLILVDQHAAHERVTFEKLRAELRAGGIRVQAMLTPVPIELNPARAPQVHQALSRVSRDGFRPRAVRTGDAAAQGRAGGVRRRRRRAAAGRDDRRDGRGRFPARRRHGVRGLLKQLACHGSVRVGRVLREPEISALLDELDRTEFKTNCPHGRPVHIQLGRGHIERMFRRRR